MKQPNPTTNRRVSFFPRLYKAIARFAARAKSGPGFPPAWAELADPNVGETGGFPNQHGEQTNQRFGDGFLNKEMYVIMDHDSKVMN